MPDQNASRTPVSDALPRAPRAWSAPEIRDLPALVDLTLRSPIGGNEGGFGWLDAVDSPRRLG
mgnify:FL=1